MKKFLLLLTAFSTMFFTSCSEDDAEIMGPNNVIVGFQSSELTKSFLNDASDAELLVPIGFVSYLNETFPANDVTLNWKVVEDTSADAAIEGVDYDLPSGGSGTAVIPAGQSTSFVKVNVHPDQFDAFNPRKLTLLITSASGSVVGKQYEKVQIVLQAICVSNIDGVYDLVVTVTAGAGVGAVYNLPGEVVTKIGTARYKASSIGPYNDRGLVSPTAQIPGAGLVFDDNCGQVALWKDPTWSDQGDTGISGGQAQDLGPYYNPVYHTPAQAATSSIDPVTGVITIDYNIWFASGTRTYRGVYTPQ